MPSLKTALTLAAALAAALALTGCRPAEMAAPAALTAAAPRMAVKGRPAFFNQSAMTFGPWRVTGIDRGWTQSSEWGAAWKEVNYADRSATQDINFTVSPPAGGPWQCRCTTKADQNLMRVIGQDSSLRAEMGGTFSYACSFMPPAGRPWTLALGRQAGGRSMQGYMGGPGGSFRVTGTSALKGSSIPLSEASGYLIALGGQPVGAVEVINEGAVWINPAAPPDHAAAMAATAAALLLHQNIGAR